MIVRVDPATGDILLLERRELPLVSFVKPVEELVTAEILQLDRGFGRTKWRPAIIGWQCQKKPAKTIILLDQPTIVRNSKGQRPVENLVAAPVSLRYGGVQPANTAKIEMFGEDAPVWHFLAQFGGAADPHAKVKAVYG